MEKTVFDLKLHESTQINNGLLVQRVVSGWNYIYTKQVWDEDGDVWEDEIVQIVFVPMPL
tara:strand:- start:171 stop:350 length:180 start_codon:yes stop_codon:yes gene_type:complete